MRTRERLSGTHGLHWRSMARDRLRTRQCFHSSRMNRRGPVDLPMKKAGAEGMEQLPPESGELTDRLGDRGLYSRTCKEETMKACAKTEKCLTPQHTLPPPRRMRQQLLLQRRQQQLRPPWPWWARGHIAAVSACNSAIVGWHKRLIGRIQVKQTSCVNVRYENTITIIRV
jgi:hypothetical protein